MQLRNHTLIALAISFACIANPCVQANAAASSLTPVQLYDKITGIVVNDFYDDRARTPEFKRAVARYRKRVKTREEAILAARTIIARLADPYSWLLDRTTIQRREAKRSGYVLSPRTKVSVPTPTGVVEEPVRVVTERSSVEADWINPETAYLVISDFDNRLLSAQLQRAVTAMNVSNAKYLVLDLRENVGGFINGAAQLLGFLMGSKNGIATLKTSHGTQPLSLNWPSGNPQFKGKVAVLVNHHSASASELVAAAIQKAHRGKLVGEPTAGSNLWKGDREIEPGLVLYLAFAEWKVSPGKFTGLIPDVPVPVSPPEIREGMTAWFSYFPTFDLTRDMRMDKQLKRAVQVVRE